MVFQLQSILAYKFRHYNEITTVYHDSEAWRITITPYCDSTFSAQVECEDGYVFYELRHLQDYTECKNLEELLDRYHELDD